MEEFRNIIEKEKKELLLNEDNVIHIFFNYVLNDIMNEYKIAYVFYNLSNSNKYFNEKYILQLSIIVNLYSTFIEIIYNLPFFLNIDTTNNKPSVHKTFNDTITILGVMFSINHLMKIHLTILEKLELKTTNIINNILPSINQTLEIFDNRITNTEINDIIDNNSDRDKHLLNSKKNKKIDFIEITLNYLKLLNKNILFNEDNLLLLSKELKENDINIDKIKLSLISNESFI